MVKHTDFKDSSLYTRFGLTLMVTHACNMRCPYCYNGPAFELSMSPQLGRKAIDRSILSIKKGGLLELKFTGGEPLLEADLVSSLIDYARAGTHEAGLDLRTAVITNGTMDNRRAWSIIMDPHVNIAVSLDGRPETHDRYRYFADGKGSSETVMRTVHLLLDAGKIFKTVTVVRPQTVNTLADEVEYLRNLGIRHIDLSLDVWTPWNSKDIENLERSIVLCSRLWTKGSPHININWFDDKVTMLMDHTHISTRLCGFGKGDIAVSPSGNLYPCDRLITADGQRNPMRLPGKVMQGRDFLFGPAKDIRIDFACHQCSFHSVCNTTCGALNYARTRHAGKPDYLLCMWNQWCLREAQAAMEKTVVLKSRTAG